MTTKDFPSAESIWDSRMDYHEGDQQHLAGMAFGLLTGEYDRLLEYARMLELRLCEPHDTRTDWDDRR